MINVGRGTTVDQAALEAALRAGAISGAGLDVTDPEPLPAESTLWDAPNLLLTPHAAGGRVVGAVERILANAAAVEATPSDEPLTGLEAQVTRASHCRRCEPDRSRRGVRPISSRKRTDLGAEYYRSRRGRRASNSARAAGPTTSGAVLRSCIPAFRPATASRAAAARSAGSFVP